MEKQVALKYNEASSLLKEGDVLLFRGQGFISNLIKVEGVGPYSHVAIASTVNNDWEAIEFREWYGGRSLNLYNYIELSKNSNTTIDVYRSVDSYSSLVFDEQSKTILDKIVYFDGKKVTTCMRKLTGLPYSYKRIWLIFKIKLFKWHLWKNLDTITNDLPTDEIIYPVCSTVLAHCFTSNNYDIMKCKSDEWTEPSDFAKSPRLNYLFTLDV